MNFPDPTNASAQVGGGGNTAGAQASGNNGTAAENALYSHNSGLPLKVAIKILDKSKINNNETRTRQLVQEIRVHWALEKCEGVIKVLELFEDDQFVYMIIEYQKQGTLLQQIL